ncbi:hypothetical protein [Marinomonas mediterranea]|uniref:hypothetical protein n=1 Tax=Marinomonas mediterranea TaxID=119864 RepID=UPI002349339B|nr:hypothetical protein [Marinomonas mediterranea]WCN08241.1 hypothetical protein GV055_04570 [Marinomonas mediterranea]
MSDTSNESIANQLGEWKTLFTSFYGLYGQACNMLNPSTRNSYACLSNMSTEKWNTLKPLIQGIADYLYSSVIMLQEGYKSLQNGKIPTVLPPPMSIPDWSTAKQPTMLQDIVNIIQQPLVVMYEQISHKSPIIKLFILGIFINLDQILSAIQAIIEFP